MIIQVFNKDCFKVISLFALSPGSRFRRKEIKEKTILNNVLLDKALAKLLSAKIIRREHNFYLLDFENKATKEILGLAIKEYKELRELPFKIHLLLTDLVEEISILKNIEVFLFGSYSKLIFNEKSDIDIAILIPKGFDKRKIKNKTTRLEVKYKKKIETHIFEKKDFYNNKKDPLVKDIIKNGIKLI